jgi:putative ABC transport system ATP-binding protein
MIHLDEVGKTYSKGRLHVPALARVTFQIAERDFIAIQGPSGSGKSTLLNLIGLLDDPTSGAIRLFGQDVSALGRRERARLRGRAIGFVFQSYNLIPHLSAWLNVALPLRYAGVSRAERRSRALEALAAVGLQDRIGHLPAELSGGEEQRVAIARSLVINPKIILADEPTGNLDTESGTVIMNQFDRLHQNGKTLLVVTHDPIVAPYASRLISIHDGTLVYDSASSPT